ncbi:MAG: ABC transporter permease [Chloroflexi bacterium]|nr:ABC transporter permease [Chloroflexota bacterium]
MSLRYVGRRVLQVLPVVAGILLIGFALIELAPGDPVLALAGESGDEAYYAFVRERFGLDRPLPERFLIYAGNIMRGDLGVSYVQGRPVIDVIADRLPPTMLLTGAALLISTIVGISLGVYAATRRQRLSDIAIQVTTLAADAAPVFWVGQLAILAFALNLGLFPVQGMADARTPQGILAGILDLAHHLALPAMVLAVGEIAVVARMTRVGLIDELTQDYVRTARAKGLSERTVVLRHALRRALIPVTTVIGGRVGHLISGAVIVETIFGWPGLGRLLVIAMQTRDMPIVMGIFLLVSLSVVIANLITDLIYGQLDPRIAYG